jgi:hypothetical protein
MMDRPSRLSFSQLEVSQAVQRLTADGCVASRRPSKIADLHHIIMMSCSTFVLVPVRCGSTGALPREGFWKIYD